MVYQVYRRATATGEFTYLGGSGAKTFVDSTIPAGSSQVTYQIQARSIDRSRRVGAVQRQLRREQRWNDGRIGRRDGADEESGVREEMMNDE